MEPEFYYEPSNINVFREDTPDNLRSVESQVCLFKCETLDKSTSWNMHKYIIDHREIIFGTYLWLTHEFKVRSGYSIDFVGFDQDGAVYVIEVKRKEDSRNRQEVISQILKYGIASSDLKSILDKFQNINKNHQCHNKNLEDEDIERLKERIRTNINGDFINVFIVTEDANDDLLATAFYVSFGPKFREISVVEIKRMTIDGQLYCFLRKFNNQGIYQASGRKDDADLNQKIDRIKILKVKELIKQWAMDWKVDPLTVATPEFITLKDPDLAFANYYIDKKKNKTYSRAFEANSIAFWVYCDPLIEDRYPQDFKDWVMSFKDASYQVETSSGKFYCINLSKIDDAKIDEVFSKMEYIVSQK